MTTTHTPEKKEATTTITTSTSSTIGNCVDEKKSHKKNCTLDIQTILKCTWFNFPLNFLEIQRFYSISLLFFFFYYYRPSIFYAAVFRLAASTFFFGCHCKSKEFYPNFPGELFFFIVGNRKTKIKIQQFFFLLKPIKICYHFDSHALDFWYT